jgi:protein tyrosine/serine phosphatase
MTPALAPLAGLPVCAPSFNLRDYGGYDTASGARLRMGKLYRSGELDAVDGTCLGLLASLGVESVIDLRGPSELGGSRGPAFVDFAGALLFARAADETVPHAIGALGAIATRAGVVAHMEGIYRALPESPRFRESLGLYLNALADGHGATLVHCFAGKDRTGLAVALLHCLLGVPRKDLFADYLLTNEMGPERVERGAAALRRKVDPGVDDDVLREVMSVRPEYLDAALSQIALRYGSPAAYLREAAGIDDAAISRIEARLLD